MSHRFDNFVEDILIKSGWFNGRKVETLVSEWKSQLKKSDGLDIFPKAEEILEEFGGLKIKQRGNGLNYSRETFEINPSFAMYEGDRFLDFSKKFNLNIYPLGEVYGGYYFLTVNVDGRVFAVGDRYLQIGNSFDEALNALIVGIPPAFVSK